MVAAIVARELLISGLRLAAIERGVVIAARDLWKLKTWAQATAAALGGLRPPVPGTTASRGGRCSSRSC
jgi:phosphatidylglycerophosphate synthase